MAARKGKFGGGSPPVTKDVLIKDARLNQRDATKINTNSLRIRELLGAGRGLSEEAYSEITTLNDENVRISKRMDARTGKSDPSTKK